MSNFPSAPSVLSYRSTHALCYCILKSACWLLQHCDGPCPGIKPKEADASRLLVFRSATWSPANPTSSTSAGVLLHFTR
jgi:hypothetical protein